MAWPKGKSRKPVEDSGVAVLDEPTDAQGCASEEVVTSAEQPEVIAPPPAPPAVTATPPAPLCCPTCGQSCTPDMLPQGKFFECISANGPRKIIRSAIGEARDAERIYREMYRITRSPVDVSEVTLVQEHGNGARAAG